MTGLARDAAKLALARELGADHVIDVEHEELRRRVRELTDGRGADVVVEVSAYTTEPVAEALWLVATHARVVLAGVKGFKAVPDFVSDLVVVKEVTPDRRVRRHEPGVRGGDPSDRIGPRAARAHAHARLRARGGRARHPDARWRGARRAEHPLVPAAGEDRMSRDPYADALGLAVDVRRRRARDRPRALPERRTRIPDGALHGGVAASVDRRGDLAGRARGRRGSAGTRARRGGPRGHLPRRRHQRGHRRRGARPAPGQGAGVRRGRRPDGRRQGDRARAGHPSLGRVGRARSAADPGAGALARGRRGAARLRPLLHRGAVHGAARDRGAARGGRPALHGAAVAGRPTPTPTARCTAARWRR